MKSQEKSVKTPNVNPEALHLTAVRIVKAQIENTSGDLKKDDELDLTFETKTSFNIERKYCSILFTVDLAKINQQVSEIQATFTFGFDFIVDNLEDFLISEEKESSNNIVYKMHYVLGVSLMNIVYGTSRGIILTRTAGTILDGVILPIFDISSLLQQEAS